jgi:hypothetical protein
MRRDIFGSRNLFDLRRECFDLRRGLFNFDLRREGFDLCGIFDSRVFERVRRFGDFVRERERFGLGGL